MNVNFYKKYLISNKAKSFSILLLGLVVTAVFFQNCSRAVQDDIKRNPNKAPLSQTGGGIMSSPGTLKNKLINGVEVPGFDVGTWMYVFVEDQCVVARKDIIMNSPFYFLDPYLKAQYDFAAGVGRFDISLISFQLNVFISSENFERALSLDNCASAAYVSSDVPNQLIYNSPNTTGGSASAWNQMGLDSSVLQQLLSLNKSRSVEFGITAPGFNPNITPALPLSANAIGLPTVDPDGFGTFMASVVAAPKSSNNVQGVADGITKLIPVSLPTDYTSWKLPSLVLAMLKQMVNRGSEVVVLPLSASDENFCDPLVGQALYYAIERGVTVVIPSGEKVGMINPAPGEIVGPRDFSLFEKSKTAQISCWGRYFRGVITVGSKAKSNSVSDVNVASFSNYGAEGVEILTPGEDIIGIEHLSHLNTVSGSGVSAALTGGAIAHIISFYKSKGWYYSPWLIEDTLMNGSPVASSLPDTGKTVRRKKYLNFTTLKDFITTLNSGTEEQARSQATDNPEGGQSINLSSVQPGERPMKMDVYSKASNVYVKDRSQFQAVYYYTSGAVKVVTDQVVWSSSDSANFPVDQQGIVRPKIAGTFTITAVDTATGLTNAYTTQAISVDSISGESAKLVRLELRDMWGGSTKYISPINGGYKMLDPMLYADVYAIYDNGIARKITDNTVYTVFLNGQVLGAEYIQNRPAFGNLVHYGFFRGGQTHDLVIFYRGFQQHLKIQTPAYSFVGWKWPYNIHSAPYSQPVASYTETKVTLYNLGQWFGIQYKIPTCYFLGKEMTCPTTVLSDSGYGCGSTACGYLPTTTLPSEGLSVPGAFGQGSQVPVGNYKVNQEFYFWGDNSGQRSTSSIDVQVIAAPRTPVIAVAGWPAGFPEESSSPDSSEKTVQLAPVCLGIQALVYNRNSDLGIDEFLRKQIYDSVAQINISSGAGVYTGFQADSGTGGILMNEPVIKPQLNLTLTDLNISKQIVGPDRIVTDAMDTDLNVGEKIFGNSGLATQKSLPALPVTPVKNPVCLNPAKNNGSHSGTGSEGDPFIICKWPEFNTMILSLSDVDSYGTYLALGADIDLSSETKPMMNFPHGIKSIDGRNYHVRNGNIIDTENDVFIFRSVNFIHNIIFQNNNLTGKNTSLIAYGSNVWSIYAYDNILVGDYVSVIAQNSVFVKNIFTRNQLRYSNYATGVSGTTSTTVLESFSKDDVRYVGIVGQGGSSGVGSNAAFSGSASTIVGGRNIAGVATSYCHKCYSEVDISSTNTGLVGGISLSLNRIGNIELGESKAKIVVAGTGITGGLVAQINSQTGYNPLMYSLVPTNMWIEVQYKYGHTHLMKSKFTGSISGTGVLGAAIGSDTSTSDTYFSDSDFSGTVSGEGIKGALIGQSNGRCISAVNKAFKVHSVSFSSGLPAVGKGIDNLPVQNPVGF